MFMEYAWLIPLLPMLSFLLVGFFGHKSRWYGGYITIFGAASAFVISCLVAYDFWTSEFYTVQGYYSNSIPWFNLGDYISSAGSYVVNIGVHIDSLSCVMALFASFISMLIFVYSLGYMGDQGKRKRRYFAEVSLFLTGMLGMAVSSNMVEMFLFWELMGLCSYLLIGFWSFNHHEGDDASDNAASAAKKAFLVTRAGDICLIGGLFILYQALGSLDYTVIFNQANLASMDHGMLVLAALLIFGGAIGKSAQFPLMDWLPDAMAGPTTVSALIHSATMVNAGVYITARCMPLMAQDANVVLFIAVIGGFTAFFAATMAMNNMNIKKVLAYSTVSQLGYMFLALGAGGYLMCLGTDTGDSALLDAGKIGFMVAVFHMMNHAFFKGLLFLGSGSVIHSCGTEDMRLMGGLGKKMKITSLTMLIGCLSIAGFPFFSGFWSKDLVIETALEAGHFGSAGWIFMLVWVLAMVTAFMTAFYMFRLWFMTFSGKEGANTLTSHGESPKSMTVPLMILSLFAFAFGYVLMFGYDGLLTIIPSKSGLWAIGNGTTENFGWFTAVFSNMYTWITIVLVFLAIALAYFLYSKSTLDAGKFNKNGKSLLYTLCANRWYMPEIYNQVSWKLGYGVANAVNFFDTQAIDGTVNGLANSVVGSGEAVGKAQTGNVHDYTAVVAVGTVVLFVCAILLCVVFGGI